MLLLCKSVLSEHDQAPADLFTLIQINSSLKEIVLSEV